MHRYPRLIAFAISVALTSVSCTARSEPQSENIDLSALLITTDDMPPGWSLAVRAAPGFDERRSSDSVYVVFIPTGDPEMVKVQQDVYRFGWAWQAGRDFDNAVRENSGTGAPQGWQFQSAFADESHISCRTYSNFSFPVCYWTARYGRIMIEFIVWLPPGRMTVADMEKVVSAVDQRAGAMLRRP